MSDSGLQLDDEGLIRLQKLLAQSGVASRRKCEELMLAGVVVVDGEVVTRLGTKVDPRTAVIRVEGKRLPPISDKVGVPASRVRARAARPGGAGVQFADTATVAIISSVAVSARSLAERRKT